MIKFIEVTETNGARRTINVNYITEIREEGMRSSIWLTTDIEVIASDSYSAVRDKLANIQGLGI